MTPPLTRAVALCVAVSMLPLASCRQQDRSRAAAFTAREVTGTVAERVDAALRLLPGLRKVPRAILDANAVIEQHGDGTLGPSDLTTFQAMRIDPAVLPAWRAALGPVASHDSLPPFVAPRVVPPWWITPSKLPVLEVHLHSPLVMESRGWVALDTASAMVYVYSVTM